MTVPLHPQACPGRPDLLRWVTPADVVPFTGPVAVAPDPLAALVADGTLTDLRWESSALLTRLGPGRSWADAGPRVRTALHSALQETVRRAARWAPADPQDATLRALAVQVIDGAVGQLARAHGGQIELADVRDGVVHVRLLGACNGCPAAATTLHSQLETRLRQQFPDLRAVVANAGRCPRGRRRRYGATGGHGA